MDFFDEELFFMWAYEIDRLTVASCLSQSYFLMALSSICEP